MKTRNLDREAIIDLINENKWLQYIIYAGGALVCVWILGKSSRVLATSILEFKTLKNAIKQ